MGNKARSGWYHNPQIKCGFCGLYSIFVHATDHVMQCVNDMCPYKQRKGVFARLNPSGAPYRELTFSGNSIYDINNRLRRVGFMPKRPDLTVWKGGREWPSFGVNHYI